LGQSWQPAGGREGHDPPDGPLVPGIASEGERVGPLLLPREAVDHAREEDQEHNHPKHDGTDLTFRTLFRPFDAIFEEPRVESGAGAIYRPFYAL